MARLETHVKHHDNFFESATNNLEEEEEMSDQSIWSRVEEIIAARLECSTLAAEVVQCLAAMPVERREAWFQKLPSPPSSGNSSIALPKRKSEPRWMSDAPRDPQ